MAHTGGEADNYVAERAFVEFALNSSKELKLALSIYAGGGPLFDCDAFIQASFVLITCPVGQFRSSEACRRQLRMPRIPI